MYRCFSQREKSRRYVEKRIVVCENLTHRLSFQEIVDGIKERKEEKYLLTSC